jgi:hypothetical protein
MILRQLDELNPHEQIGEISNVYRGGEKKDITSFIRSLVWDLSFDERNLSPKVLKK